MDLTTATDTHDVTFATSPTPPTTPIIPTSRSTVDRCRPDTTSLTQPRRVEGETGAAPSTLTAVPTPTTIADVTTDVGDAGDDSEDAGTSYARCSDGNGTLSHLFFSDDDHELARAKAICRPCGLRATCLAGALERQEPYGVWGGLLVLDGVAVEVKRKRGRPPKQPTPVLVVDEVPIPAHLVA